MICHNMSDNKIKIKMSNYIIIIKITFKALDEVEENSKPKTLLACKYCMF